jgi:hypothetical protein
MGETDISGKIGRADERPMPDTVPHYPLKSIDYSAIRDPDQGVAYSARRGQRALRMRAVVYQQRDLFETLTRAIC